MLSKAELRRAARILDATLAGARLERIVQPDELGVVLSFRAADRRDAHLRLTCRPLSARAALLAARPQAPREPPAFCSALRKSLDGTTCSGVDLAGEDRQLALRLRAREGGTWTLLLSLLGPRSNVYLLDGKGVLRQALRPLARTRRALAIGEPWRDPESPPPREGEDRFALLPDAEYLSTLEARGAALDASEDAAEIGRRLERALAREGSALERRLAALRRDLEGARDAEAERRRGELLKSVLDRVQPRASSVQAEDFETGERVEIPLDPALSARENLEAIFRRYRKRSRALAHLEREIAGGEAQAREHEALRGEAHALLQAVPPDAERLAELAARPSVRRLLARHAPRPPAARPARARRDRDELPARLSPRRYRSSAGLEIWVGKTDEGNDHLTTRLARGNDLFFHLDGSPGSHVVLRTEGRRDPPGEALLDAAELAVHFSKQRDAVGADVHVAPIKQVQKPKRAKPGLVYVTGGRTLRLRRDPARLERVLSARIEDGEGD